MIRTFIAVDLPKSFIPTIEKIQHEFRIPGIKLVEPELVHITLKFLGNIHESNIKAIALALSKIRCKPFQASIKGVGTFHLRVIWLGVYGNFEVLHEEVEKALQPFKFERDLRFSPHATLARVKTLKQKELILEKIKKLENIEVGSFDVNSILMKKSTLTPKGPIYETLKEIKLQ